MIIRKEDLVRSATAGFGVALTGTAGNRGVGELGAVGWSRKVAQSGRQSLVHMFQILVFLWNDYLHIICAVVFITGLADEEQLLVMFPLRRVRFVRAPASLDRLVFTVKNCSQVLEFALYVFN